MTHSPNPALPPLTEALQAHGLHANKSLGQHFLLQESWVKRIAQLAQVPEGMHAVEIGPGPGGLTRALLQHTPLQQLVAVEKDTRFAPVLEPLAQAFPGRFTLQFADALRTSPRDLVPAPRMIISNLPYNVGTELLVGWLQELITHGDGVYEKMVLMFQLEVANRLRASINSKAYGRLSVLAQWLCEVRTGLHVPAGAFSPPPQVESEVVILTPRPVAAREPAHAKALQHITAAAFNQRRKMLRGALKALTPEPETLLRAANINPESRAEAIDIAGFARLSLAWADMQGWK